MARFRMVLLMAAALFGADLSAEGLESKAPKLVTERPNASGSLRMSRSVSTC